MDKSLDQDFKTISTPVDAEKHYLSFVESGEMDLMAVKKELRESHNFTEEDVRITANILSKASMKAQMRKDGMGSSVFGIGLGAILTLLGIMMTFYLWNKGFITLLSYFVIAAGLSILIGAIRALQKT